MPRSIDDRARPAGTAPFAPETIGDLSFRQEVVGSHGRSGRGSRLDSAVVRVLLRRQVKDHADRQRVGDRCRSFGRRRSAYRTQRRRLERCAPATSAPGPDHHAAAGPGQERATRSAQGDSARQCRFPREPSTTAGAQGGNILDVQHDRVSGNPIPRSAEIVFDYTLDDGEPVGEIVSTIKACGSRCTISNGNPAIWQTSGRPSGGLAAVYGAYRHSSA